MQCETLRKTRYLLGWVTLMSEVKKSSPDIWLFTSFYNFTKAVIGENTQNDTEGLRSSTNSKECPIQIEKSCQEKIPLNLNYGTPVLVAVKGEIKSHYPRMEGRYRQSLPKVHGSKLGNLPKKLNLIGRNSGVELEAWLIPNRPGKDTTLVITLKEGLTLRLDIREWPSVGGDQQIRLDKLRKASQFLISVPTIFATTPSISSAYERLEDLWEKAEEVDPKSELLKKQAGQLGYILEQLAVRPRTVLRTQHRLLKLQAVKRTDNKTIQWLSSQPGRNTAERAGARQRILAPKRKMTINTLENQVLRAFVSLTVKETDIWINNHKDVRDKELIRAHKQRASRINQFLTDSGVSVAKPPVIPNFPLRFDPNYRKIWKAWGELRRMKSIEDLEWMWQDRTLMELDGLRIAMEFNKCVKKHDGGPLTHGSIMLGKKLSDQGLWLNEDLVNAQFGFFKDGRINKVHFFSGNKVNSLGAVASTDLEKDYFNNYGKSDEDRVDVSKLLSD